jgi:hypothetical protein
MAESTPLMAPWIFNQFAPGNLIIRLDYDVNLNAIYQGWAQPGTLTSDAAWRIVQNTYGASSQFLSSAFPGDVNGNPSCAFAFVWDNRTTYAYS